MPTTCCEFVDDSGIVAFNGIDHKPFLLPTKTYDSKPYFRLDFKNRDVALFFTGKNVSSRPFKCCSIKNTLLEAVQVTFAEWYKRTTSEDGDGENLAESGVLNDDAASFRRWKKWRRAEGLLCEIQCPKSPKSDDCRRMRVHLFKHGVDVHATAENITWLLRYVRTELGLLDKCALKRRRVRM